MNVKIFSTHVYMRVYTYINMSYSYYRPCFPSWLRAFQGGADSKVLLSTSFGRKRAPGGYTLTVSVPSRRQPDCTAHCSGLQVRVGYSSGFRAPV